VLGGLLEQKKKKRSWVEAPLFHLAGLLFTASGFFWTAFCYVRDIPAQGWYNDWVPGMVVYVLLTVYFVCGCRSGAGEAEAVEEVLEKKERRNG